MESQAEAIYVGGKPLLRRIRYSRVCSVAFVIAFAIWYLVGADKPSGPRLAAAAPPSVTHPERQAFGAAPATARSHSAGRPSPRAHAAPKATPSRAPRKAVRSKPTTSATRSHPAPRAGSTKKAAASRPARSQRATRTVGATPATLIAHVEAVGHRVYWAGVRPGYRFEVTRFANGGVVVRYLPPGLSAGAGRGRVSTVSTFRHPHALAAIRVAAGERGGVLLRLPHGRLAAYNTSRPTHVYFADPGSGVEVEVFDPSARRARALVASGVVRPFS